MLADRTECCDRIEPGRFQIILIKDERTRTTPPRQSRQDVQPRASMSPFFPPVIQFVYYKVSTKSEQSAGRATHCAIPRLTRFDTRQETDMYNSGRRLPLAPEIVNDSPDKVKNFV
ncbi:hypothetical protein J6590_032202 [Homalodisca vitripennis]|nr:hypothetical protein J6590_032202 [Homalodisca vitripennis]